MKTQNSLHFFLMLCLLCIVEFSFSQVFERYDIIVSEIMAKPTPCVGLPDVEYLELHNRTQSKVVLKNWKLKIGSTQKELPDIEIDSSGYAVLVALKNQHLIEAVCDNVYSLSSMAITDGGQAISLFDNFGNIMHFVDFRRAWHTESIKQEGGWALEIKDVDHPYLGKHNWDSSIDKSGGTPGKKNSIAGSVADNEPLRLLAVTLTDSATLRAHFSKCIDSRQDFASLFKFTPEIDVVKIDEVPATFSSLDFRFTENLDPKARYKLEFMGGMTDCAGRTHHYANEVCFGIPSQASRGDVVINEILTDPNDYSDADYIELYNNSGKILDMKYVRIGYGGDTMPKKSVVAVPAGWQLLPQSYILLCKQRDVTTGQFFCKNEDCVVENDSLPNFVASEGVIHVTDGSLQPVDRLHYTGKMHYPKLLTTKGVALERICFSCNTQDDSNWHSAAETAGFGTPGYENSHSGGSPSASDLEITPEVISPDNDGFGDFAEIICNFEEAENRVNILIYNDKGVPVRRVANNVLCGLSNHFKWDGCDDNGNLLPAGMYVCVVEKWNLLSGKTKRYKKVVSIYQ